MANLNLNIPDNQEGRILNAFEDIYGPKPNRANPNPTPLTHQQQVALLKSTIIDFIKNVIKQSEIKIVVETARINTIENIESEINVT